MKRDGLAERLRVMVITDPRLGDRLVDAVGHALRAGVPAIQLRWKEGSSRELLGLANELRRLTRDAGALLLVNDRVDVALAADADGAHLGDDDLPLDVARRLVGPSFILGRSVDTAEEARAAEAAGADYVGFGPIFSTLSKEGLGAAVGLAAIAEVRARITIPLVAIGGIGAAEAGGAIRAGADGIAVISAVMSAADPFEEARNVVRAAG